MKKIITMIVALVATVSTFAQQEVGTLSVAPKFGVNFSNMTEAKNSTMRVGLTGGVDLTYQMSENFAISGGLLYSQQGMKQDNATVITQGNAVASGKATVKNDYFNVPIMANYYVCPGLALKVGVQIGALLSAKVTTDISATDGVDSMKGEETHDDKEAYNSIDFGFPVGVSYEYKNFIVDARYNIGIVDALKDIKSRNSVITLTLGYKFGL